MKNNENLTDQLRPLCPRYLAIRINSNGCTFEDLEHSTGYNRAALQLALKGTLVDGPNGPKLEGGYYSTVEGYLRLLENAYDNAKKQRATAKKNARHAAKQAAASKQAAEKAKTEAAEAQLDAEKANAEVEAAKTALKQATAKLEEAKANAQKAKKKASDTVKNAKLADKNVAAAEAAAEKAAQKVSELEDVVKAAKQDITNIAAENATAKKAAAEKAAAEKAAAEKAAAENAAAENAAAENAAAENAAAENAAAENAAAENAAEKAAEMEAKKAAKQPAENTLGKFAVIDTGVLYNLATLNKPISDLYKAFQLVVFPEVCIRELEAASNASLRNPKLSKIARNLLSEISELGPEFMVLSSNDCAELLSEPSSFNHPVRDRSRDIVGALCYVWTHNTIKDSSITLITTTRQVCKLACQQRFPHEVQIRRDEAVFIA